MGEVKMIKNGWPGFTFKEQGIPLSLRDFRFSTEAEAVGEYKEYFKLEYYATQEDFIPALNYLCVLKGENSLIKDPIEKLESFGYLNLDTDKTIVYPFYPFHRRAFVKEINLIKAYVSGAKQSAKNILLRFNSTSFRSHVNFRYSDFCITKGIKVLAGPQCLMDEFGYIACVCINPSILINSGITENKYRPAQKKAFKLLIASRFTTDEDYKTFYRAFTKSIVNEYLSIGIEVSIVPNIVDSLFYRSPVRKGQSKEEIKKIIKQNIHYANNRNQESGN